MIECKNISIRTNENTLLKEFSQTFKRGEFWAVLGKNGIGKTTLLDTLAGFRAYNSGSVLLNQQELSGLSILNRAQKISYLSQLHEASLDGSVIQSVSFGRYAWQQNSFDTHQENEIIQKALKEMQLEEIKSRNVLQLSGGERRKVELATLFAQDGEVLLLDEPLNHLDLNFRVKLMKKLKQSSETKLVILVTHDLQFVQKYCSHVLIIENQNSWVAGSIESTMIDSNLNKMLDINMEEIIL